MRSRLSIVSLSFVFALLQAVLMARVAFSAAASHRTVEMTPVAAEGELPRPWDNGSFSWEVPARWRVMDNGDSEKEFPWSNQQFSITSEGTVRVSKFGLQVERAISQNFGTIQ